MSDQVYDDPGDPGLHDEDERGLVSPGVDPEGSVADQPDTSHEADIAAGYDDDPSGAAAR